MTTLDTQQLSPGDVLPELGIDITAKLIVGGAIASRDFQDVHHDKTAAQALGSADLFMNILTTNGLVGRYVTDWAGRGARLKKLAIGLGVPNFPGDHMTLSGRVATVNRETSVVEVEIRGANSHGDHVTGRVSVELTRC